ncbi:MAG: DEAD/DEAH box helicase, partial [Bacteroidia bacterium]|nr:DEAD/DEAH box helicase [Bacteroidia bacterium]
MVQSYTTECKNANTSIKKVGFKVSNKSQRPVLTSDCDIRQIYKIIAKGTPQTPPKTEFNQLREYSRLYYHTIDINTDPRAKKYAQFLKQQIDDLKQKLPAIVFSGNTTRHTKQAVTEAFNGVIQSDIDFHYWNGDKDAERLKDKLKADPYILGAFISPSGYGLKIQIHTDNAADQYTATRDAFNRYLSDQYGVPFDVIDVLPISQTCYLSYDPEIYTNLTAAAFNEKYQAPQPKRTAHTATTTPPSEAKNIIESIITEVERKQIDITQNYERWYRIGLAIAHHFGEPGRVYFHDISKYYPGYRASATDNQYNSYLRAATTGAPVTIATVIKYAQEYGIKVKSTDIEVVNPDQIIKVDRYVSEATADISQAIQEHEKICIVAPTSTGKTQAFFKHILPQIEGKHIVALPYVANVKQAEQRHKCGALYGNLDFIDYSTAYQNKIIATTYDQAARLPGDTLIIDEAHNLSGQYNFRPDAIQAIEAAQRDKKRVILITATPSPMFQMDGFHVLQIEPKEKPQQRVKLRPYSDKKHAADIVYQEAQKAITANEKALVKYNHIDLLQHVAAKLRKQYPGKNIGVLYSDQDNSTNDTAQAISEGKFPFDVLLCTSVINDGVSIDKTFVHRVISVEKEHNPIPKNLVQFIARPRQDVDKIKYICYYLQAKQPNKKRRAVRITSLYQDIKDSNARRCKGINDTLQPDEDPTGGDNLSRIGNFKSQITLNRNTGLFEPSTFAAMHDAEQIYRNTLTLEAFTATIEANYPYITIEVDNQYSVDQDKDLQKEMQKDKDQDKEDQRQIYKLIKEGKQDMILEYVCKKEQTDFKVVKAIQEHQRIDRRNKNLSNEAQELHDENKSLFKRSHNTLERVSLRLCTCMRYGIKSAENIIFNDDKVIRHGKSFNDIITSIEAQILTTCSAEDLNRLSKHDQKIIFKILQIISGIKIPMTRKQIHKKILDAIGSNEPYFNDEQRTMNIVKTFFNLQRYQADKS